MFEEYAHCLKTRSKPCPHSGSIGIMEMFLYNMKADAGI